ncbi:MAG: proton-conducting transporter membrane subunit [Candidatus Riflebacteria bacterium]|nr:proton-conducting transporter membrane subunit [Candidatus Riflebacteria bacterium]
MSTLWLIILFPILTGITTLFTKSHKIRKILLLICSVVHMALTVFICQGSITPATESWFTTDALTKIFLSITSLLYFGASLYALTYLKPDEDGDQPSALLDLSFLRNKNAVFMGCMHFFLAAMTLSIVSAHFGLQWIGVEATTLASTPLIYHHRNKKSLEAAWKYLIICSVGIALALMGIFFLAMAVPAQVEFFTPRGLSKFAGYLRTDWLQVAFIFVLVGYGTKVGFAPMHTWLPDAHSEAPSPASALLSGALLNCALLAILRVYQVCAEIPAVQTLASELFVLFGLVSMAISGIFIMHQADYKRMLAYSSVEHMGVMAFGFGLGKVAVAAALFHAICHSLIKSSLFMLAGNILSAYQTKKVEKIHGLLRTMPVTSVLWLAGFLAITGTPPFGTFMTEFSILKTAVESRNYLFGALYLLFLVLVFVGMLTIFSTMALGKKMTVNSEGQPIDYKELNLRKDGTIYEHPLQYITPIIFLAAALYLGCNIPEPILQTINEASAILGGKAL